MGQVLGRLQGEHLSVFSFKLQQCQSKSFCLILINLVQVNSGGKSKLGKYRTKCLIVLKVSLELLI